MSEGLKIYEKAVTTERSAEKLARRHGYNNVVQLAESLPPGALVLDVGSGASLFSNAVAMLRPDAAFVNFDYSYNNPAILADVVKDSPANVEYVPGDVIKLGEIYDPESFDAVYSYWLLQHLSLDDPEPAMVAARAIFEATKPGGLISIGPIKNGHRLPSMRPQRTFRIIKDDSTDADAFAEAVVAATRLQGAELRLQRFSNEVATPFFGTTRYTKQQGRIPHVYDSENGDYVSPISRRGVSILGDLALVAAQHAWRTRSSAR
jgi:SAM-dependent methyltransferase